MPWSRRPTRWTPRSGGCSPRSPPTGPDRRGPAPAAGGASRPGAAPGCGAPLPGGWSTRSTRAPTPGPSTPSRWTGTTRWPATPCDRPGTAPPAAGRGPRRGPTGMCRPTPAGWGGGASTSTRSIRGGRCGSPRTVWPPWCATAGRCPGSTAHTVRTTCAATSVRWPTRRGPGVASGRICTGRSSTTTSGAPTSRATGCSASSAGATASAGSTPTPTAGTPPGPIGG
jgi:hypothetical protein